MDYTYIDTDKQLSDYLKQLENSGTKQIALDIEGESNLHEYGERLCLIQVFDGKNSVIIDPLAVSQSLTKKFFEDRSIMKIMFDAQGDRAFLYKNERADLMSVLDLQPAVELLGYAKRDLTSVLHQSIHIEPQVSKKKFQRYNWTRRPISSEALEYALGDVIYLFALKDRLLYTIIEEGLLDSYILKNLQVQNKPHNYPSRPGILRSGRFKNLNSRSQKLVEELYKLRDIYAKQLNLPPNSVFANDQLFKLARGDMHPDDLRFGKNVAKSIQETIYEGITKKMD